MKLVSGAVLATAAGSLIALFASIAPTRATSDGAPIVAAASQRNDTIQSFTFHVNIAMAMRHFPWLHFRIEGLGDYVRGDHYLVRFTNGPFVSKMHQIDLSLIDPSMWPGRYRYAEIGQRDDDTLFALQALNDPSLKSATVALNPLSGAHWVDVTYTEGTHIHMVVNSNEVDGFLLPVALTADVDYPHMPLSANAAFTDYSITASAR
jgi:hypothetical protein